MTDTMSDIEYTKEDLKVLFSMCNEGSSIPVELEEIDYDPNKFKAYMRQLPKQFRFIYQTSLDDIICSGINNPAFQRFFTWRTSISK
jgi:hypothetical protein